MIQAITKSCHHVFVPFSPQKNTICTLQSVMNSWWADVFSYRQDDYECSLLGMGELQIVDLARTKQQNRWTKNQE